MSKYQRINFDLTSKHVQGIGMHWIKSHEDSDIQCYVTCYVSLDLMLSDYIPAIEQFATEHEPFIDVRMIYIYLEENGDPP